MTHQHSINEMKLHLPPPPPSFHILHGSMPHGSNAFTNCCENNPFRINAIKPLYPPIT